MMIDISLLFDISLFLFNISILQFDISLLFDMSFLLFDMPCHSVLSVICSVYHFVLSLVTFNRCIEKNRTKRKHVVQALYYNSVLN